MSAAVRRLAFIKPSALRKHLIATQRPVLGLDVGSYRCGFAIAENFDSVAIPLQVVKRRNLATADVSNFLQNVARAHNVGGLVVGLPLNVDGTEGVSCNRVRRFMRQVARDVDIGLPYTFYDESHTTVDAYDDLKDIYGVE